MRRNHQDGRSLDNNKSEAERWLAQAEVDLKNAGWNAEGKFWAEVCFKSQQVGEKALKAFLVSKGLRRILSHSLLELKERCAEYDGDFAGIDRECRRLDKYYIIARYPDGLPGLIPAAYFDEEEAGEAIAQAKKILGLVRQKLGMGL